MITIDGLRITYPDAIRPALRVDGLHVEEGELVLVCGPTGSGKSTLLGALTGLVPHFTGGHLQGRVLVAGRDTRTHRPRDLAGIVGYVQQNPAESFVSERVEDEIAYGLETLGLAPTVMRRRVEETLDLLDLAPLRSVPLRHLSGGQQQRVAIAAVLASGPDVLVLDEPTSALDPVAAEEVLSALQRLVHDHALTIVLAEHRLERVIHHCDAIVRVADGIASPLEEPAQAMRVSEVAPPVVALGRYAAWEPLPLSVRQARRRSGDLRRVLSGGAQPLTGPVAEATGSPQAVDLKGRLHEVARRRTFRRRPSGHTEPAAFRIESLTVRRGGREILTDVALSADAGEIVAVMGRNGSGKSTLLWSCVAALPWQAGRVLAGGRDVGALPPQERIGAIALVPQDPTDLLYAASVGEECTDADNDTGSRPGAAAELLAALAGPIDPGTHPRDLSEGQRLALALAVVLLTRPPVLLLDEPTRGLDYAAKARLVALLRELASSGTTIVLATHDVELAAEVATRVVLLADGQVVADDDGPQVLAASTAYAPQVARILAPVPVLTVADVRQLLPIPTATAAPAAPRPLP